MRGRVEDDGDARVFLVLELDGVHRDFDVGALVTGQRIFAGPGGRASAACLHAGDVDCRLVNILDHEPITRVGPAGHDAEIVAGFLEHLRGPVGILSGSGNRAQEQCGTPNEMSNSLDDHKNLRCCQMYSGGPPAPQRSVEFQEGRRLDDPLQIRGTHILRYA